MRHHLIAKNKWPFSNKDQFQISECPKLFREPFPRGRGTAHGKCSDQSGVAYSARLSALHTWGRKLLVGEGAGNPASRFREAVGWIPLDQKSPVRRAATRSVTRMILDVSSHAQSVSLK